MNSHLREWDVEKDFNQMKSMINSVFWRGDLSARVKGSVRKRPVKALSVLQTLDGEGVNRHTGCAG